jgi:hypothetical protein
MNNAAIVRIHQGATDLQEKLANHVAWQGSVFCDQEIQSTPVNVFHHEKRQILNLPDGVHWNNVRVTQTGRDFRFTAEPLDHTLLEHEAWRHDLDGDVAVQGDIISQVDPCHASAAEFVVDLELAYRRGAQGIP